MGFVDATKTCLSKYATFRGRAVRSEYWWFWVFLILLAIVAAVLDALIFGTQTLDSDSGGPIAVVTNLATFLPSLAVTVRRLHDTGRPWYYILTPVLFAMGGFAVAALSADAAPGLAAFIAVGALIIGVGLMFYWLVKPSDPYANKYGPGPNDPPDFEEVFS